MSGVLRLMEEAEARGWSPPDPMKYVCADCVADGYLQALIRQNARRRRCHYCQASAPHRIAASVDIVMEKIAWAVYRRFANPQDAGAPWDGGWNRDLLTTEDVLMEIPLNCDDDFLQDMAGSLHNEDWIPVANGHWMDQYEDETLRGAWSGFVHCVKHQTRFHLASIEPDCPGSPYELSPSEFLSRLGGVLGKLQLIQSVATDTPLYRARDRSQATDTWPIDANELGAPPPKMASAGRMNPAGISYFYCALDSDTAIKEISDRSTTRVALGKFRPSRALTVLDLSRLPETPSPFDFDNERQNERDWLIFLGAFVQDISKPIERNGQEHIEYCPTQVLSEWFAQGYLHDKGRIDGLKWRSTKRKEGINLVLFPKQPGFPVKFINGGECPIQGSA